MGKDDTAHEAKATVMHRTLKLIYNLSQGNVAE